MILWAIQDIKAIYFIKIGSPAILINSNKIDPSIPAVRFKDTSGDYFESISSTQWTKKWFEAKPKNTHDGLNANLY